MLFDLSLSVPRVLRLSNLPGVRAPPRRLWSRSRYSREFMVGQAWRPLMALILNKKKETCNVGVQVILRDPLIITPVVCQVEVRKRDGR